MQHCLLIAALWFLPAAPPRVVKGPYIQNLTENSVVICWHTDSPANSRVLYGLRMNQLNGAIFNNQQITDHFVTLTNLEPGTRYFYSFGSSGLRLNADSTQHFTTLLKKNRK